jgi:alkylation response protein AidB-like acyl-CoA dehydrogenase
MFGTPAQKQQYLAGLLIGQRWYAFCTPEPIAGSDILGIRTTAVLSMLR